MKKIKIGIIGTNGLPGRYGGWDHLLNELTSRLSEKYEITVYTSFKNGHDHIDVYNNSKLRRINLDANGWQSIPYDIYSMFLSLVNRHDIFLVFGTSGCIALPILKLFGVKIILNPDGAEWERGKWNYIVKKILYLFDKVGVSFAKFVVADNKVIYDRVIKRNKNSFLIEYGGDNARYSLPDPDVFDKYNITPKDYAFKVCRIVPENNIQLILDVFVDNKLPLVLVGNWNVSDYSRSMKSKYEVHENLKLIGPIYEQEKIDSLRSNCRVYIHGHSVGGTNPSLVEAMSLSLPCIVFDVNYNIETTGGAALYFNDKKSLFDTVNNVWFDLEKLTTIGESLKNIASSKYTWERIVNKYDELFYKITT